MEGYEEKMEMLINCVSVLKEEVRSLKSQLSLAGKPCYTNEEALKILGVSYPTLRKWRNAGLIGYSQIGSTIHYSQQDIADFLKSNHNEAYAA